MAIAKIERDGIEDGAIDTTKILDGILGTADIPNDSLTNTKFSNSAAIPTSKLTGLATSATTDTTNATNITSGSLATATTYNALEMDDGTGQMIYTEFRTPINRASDSTEDIKLVVEF